MDPRDEPPADELREEDVTLEDALDDRIPEGEQLSERQRLGPSHAGESVPKRAE